MSTEYSPFARPKFTAEDFAREDSSTTFDTAPRVAPEERTFASDDAPRAAFVDPDLVREDQVMDDTSAFAAAPRYAQSAKSTAKSSGRAMAPIAMIAIPAVALLAGVAYFTMQPRDGLIAEQPATVAVAPTPPAPLPEPTELAAVTPTPAPVEATPTPAAPIAKAATPRVTARAAAPTRVARARPAPAAAPGAEDVSAWSRDASATLPTAPVPYSATTQTPSASPAPIILPPIAAEPVAPAPSETPTPLVPDPTIPPTL
ncbi:MAG: hypothetical protein Q8Q88_04195 [Phenylobacterium sp.]|uniref:hypothetical protein n=1 Tax=Phenylobacterium sp. TaxID=1871053 RepID=UPI0027354501|nr:hypothetical protein [Phenylobacterium sp.]MDP3746233.1 hypothetical protein [Phenylobacterium sp.]